MRGRFLLCSLLISCAPGGSSPLSEEEQNSAATGAEAINLATAARIYRFNTDVPRCGAWSLDEDYSSGRYNAHRYSFDVEPNTAVELTFARQRGTWQPALILATSAGIKLFDGETALQSDGIIVMPDLSGRTGAIARLSVASASRTTVYAYTTSWSMIDARFDGGITRTAEYTFAIEETCAPGSSDGFYAGIDLEGSHIPRAGLSNSTLRRALGVSVEPYGDVVTYDGNDYVSGTISWFGGPNDTGVTSTETGAITGERLRALRGYFAAMRFDYAQNGVSWWRDARLLVVNPNTGRAVVVRPVDWGPHTRTRRVIDLSQETLRELGLTTDDEALVSFAPPTSSVGPVND